jgi:hypothetical protein
VSRRGLIGGRVETDALGRSVLCVGEATYRALVIADLEAATPELLAAVEGIAANGVPVIVAGPLPTRAWGWADHARRDESVGAAVARLSGAVTRSDASSRVGDALRSADILPAIERGDGGPLSLSLERRATPFEDILLVFNESDADVSAQLRVNLEASRVRIFDPEVASAVQETRLDRNRAFEIHVPARRWRILGLPRSR